MKAIERLSRNESIKFEYRSGKSFEEIAKQFNITSQMVRNIVKGKHDAEFRAVLETKILEHWNETKGLHRDRVKQVSEKLGVKKSQIRYVISKSWN